jgi:hypothetical protein
LNDLILRICRDGDYPELRALAERDSASIPSGRLLAAEGDGRLLAVISLETGTVIADPFVPTNDAVELLRRRAWQIRRTEGGSGFRRRRRRSRRPVAGPTAPAET